MVFCSPELVTPTDTMSRRGGLFLPLLLVCCVLPVLYGQKTCESGWAGQDCSLKCHCNDNSYCNMSSGACEHGTGCIKGWLGPSCQYVDLSQTLKNVRFVEMYPNEDWLKDDLDNTCNPHTDHTFVMATWNDPNTFSWLRLRFNERVDYRNLSDLVVTVKNKTESSRLECPQMLKAVMDDYTIDVHCSLNQTVLSVNVSGQVVTKLCSLRISGGRNLALRQKTTQSGTYANEYEKSKAENAVDGNTNTDYHAGSCVHTDRGDNPPYWQVTLSQSALVSRYIIYNRKGQETRLRKFILQSYYENDTVAQQYQDNQSHGKLMYIVEGDTTIGPVNRVKITATDKTKGFYVNFCEVEVYGDVVCPHGKFGLDCQLDCHCADATEQCITSTGSCPSGCAAGYYGYECWTACSHGFHGFNCTEPCPVNCRNNSCTNTVGNCEDGCVPGYQNDTCDQVCNPTFYGVDCADMCSTNCVDQLCHHVTGMCFQCPPGKRGDQCDQWCGKGTFGQSCVEKCSPHCAGDQSCDPVNGTCQAGCTPGFINQKCMDKCDPHMFGVDCQFNCSSHCKTEPAGRPDVCHHVNGSCLLGCQGGFTGHNCTRVSTSTSLNAGAVAGPVIVLVLLLIAVIIGVFVWKKRKQVKHNNLLGPSTRADVTDTNMEPVQVAMTASEKPAKKPDPSEFDPTPAGESKDEVYYNTFDGPGTTSIAVSELHNFMLTHSKEFFDTQFKKIPSTLNVPRSVGQSAENKHKNRYKNICAYDHSRVTLTVNEDKKHGDYINACFVGGYNNEEKFIASQGPNKAILEDFIRMLWEHKVDKVVMLTNLFEEGKSKCEMYWPEEGENEFGEIKVRLASTQVFADYTIRNLQLMKVGHPSQNLTQFHFTAWPDKGVPILPWGLVDFEQRVAAYPTDNPIVVHCSAGVGRTGTFIALRNVMREAEDSGYMDFYTTLWKLRQDRVYMIQTLEQYIFLHEAAQVALACMGTNVSSNDIGVRIEHLESRASTGLTNMEKEFKAICNVCADNQDGPKTSSDGDGGHEDEGSGGSVHNLYQNSRTVTNKLKNRFSNILPKDLYRPFLSQDTKEYGDYINAVLVPNLNKQRQQVLTQLPLPSTVVDFWRLVTQYKVALVIAFETDTNTSDSTVADCLPTTQSLQVGPFDVEPGASTPGTYWKEQELTIIHHKKKKIRLSNSSTNNEEHHLTVISCTSTELEANKLLAVVNYIKSCGHDKNGRVLYMCRNGADYSGLMCVLSLMMERLEHDHFLSVPSVVGTIKSIRPQVIPTLTQYRLLYDVLRCYSDSVNVYNNFQLPPSLNREHPDGNHKLAISDYPDGNPNGGISNPAFDGSSNDVNIYNNDVETSVYANT